MSKPRRPRTIKVSRSPISEQAWLALRKIAPALVAFALARGWLTNDVSILLAIIGGAVWPIGHDQIAAWQRHPALAELADDPAIPQVEFTPAPPPAAL